MGLLDSGSRGVGLREGTCGLDVSILYGRAF